jgi:predicted KAP-like P-loop ATPase
MRELRRSSALGVEGVWLYAMATQENTKTKKKQRFIKRCAKMCSFFGTHKIEKHPDFFREKIILSKEMKRRA